MAQIWPTEQNPNSVHRYFGTLTWRFLRSPNGVRTRASTLRGWCPRPLDDGAKQTQFSRPPARPGPPSPRTCTPGERSTSDAWDGFYAETVINGLKRYRGRGAAGRWPSCWPRVEGPVLAGPVLATGRGQGQDPT